MKYEPVCFFFFFLTKYDRLIQVVQMLFSAMETRDTIEICVMNNHLNDFYPSTNIHGINTNKNVITTTRVVNNNLSCQSSPINNLRPQTINTSHPNLHNQSENLNNITIRNLSGSVPALSTGLVDMIEFYNNIYSLY